ncbi:hypothetical protein TNCV_941951 [Trichonephila clavipes]|nr:hypothetical protein TNCV_941951 [Trichonephila clavipes]
MNLGVRMGRSDFLQINTGSVYSTKIVTNMLEGRGERTSAACYRHRHTGLFPLMRNPTFQQRNARSYVVDIERTFLDSDNAWLSTWTQYINVSHQEKTSGPWLRLTGSSPHTSHYG